MKLETYNFIKEHIDLLEVDYEKGLIINKKVCLSGNGYYHFYFKGKKLTIHSVIAFLTFGDGVIGLEINHINGTKTDNRPCNLEMVTRSENAIHAQKLGLSMPSMVIGEKHGRSKLSAVKVVEIRSLLNSGVPMKEIARKYGVWPKVISQIRDGITWSQVKS